MLILCVGGQNRYRWRYPSQVDSPQLSTDSPDSQWWWSSEPRRCLTRRPPHPPTPFSMPCSSPAPSPPSLELVYTQGLTPGSGTLPPGSTPPSTLLLQCKYIWSFLHFLSKGYVVVFAQSQPSLRSLNLCAVSHRVQNKTLKPLIFRPLCQNFFSDVRFSSDRSYPQPDARP